MPIHARMLSCSFPQAAADLLPPSAKLAHEDSLLARHWHEPLEPPALKQALAEAVAELPDMASGYHGPTDSVIVACYAANNISSKTTGELLDYAAATAWNMRTARYNE